MPLVKSSSDAAFKSNLKAELAAGKPRNQSLAIAYSVKRRNRADGGPVASDAPVIGANNFDAANKALTLNPQEQALYQRHLSNLWGSGGVDNPPSAQSPQGSRSSLYQAVIEDGGKFYNIPTVRDGRILSIDDAEDAARAEGLKNFPSYATPDEADSRYEDMHKFMDQDTGTYFQSKGRANGGAALATAFRVKRAAGGSLKPASWQVRNEARGMMHSGPIMSAVAGRTDHHPMSVKAGSYVFPADHVSSMGQGNTINGVAQLNHMFKMGPFGSSPGVIKGGAGAPRAPHIKAAGGVAGKHHGEPVPINAAGGEFVVPPEKITEWMERSGFAPDIDAGHKALDKWVVEHRKKHRKTLAKLPGPAKS